MSLATPEDPITLISISEDETEEEDGGVEHLNEEDLGDVEEENEGEDVDEDEEGGQESERRIRV